jgi:branched-chain amino acid transport system substrate-binding protein
MNGKIVALASALSVLLAAAPGFAADTAPIEIPALYPMTGPAAFIGQGQSKTLEIIERMVNGQGGIQGRPIHFSIQDDAGNPATALQLANAAIAKKPALFMGPGLTAECAAVLPLAKNGPVDYCMSPGIDPPAGSYVYSAGMAGPDLAKLYVRYFHRRGWNRIALITATAQVLIAWTAGTGFGTVLHGIQDAGVTLPVGGGGANMTYSQMEQYKDVLPKELYFPSVSSLTASGAGPGPIRDAQLIYRKAFKDAGIRPDFQNNIAWDPAMIIVAAYRAAGPQATADQLQAYIQHLHSWAGINGIYDFRDGKQRGITIGVGVIVRWDAKTGDFVAASKLGGYPL